MDAGLVWAVLVATMLGALGLVARRRGAKQRVGTSPPRAHPARPYHCVAIRSGGAGCEQASTLGDRRFLAREAPPIPLPGCTAACRCTYQHFADRRQSERRAFCTNTIYIDAAAHNERRIRQSRRQTDR